MAANKIQVGYIEAQDGAQFEVDAGTAAAPGLCFDNSAATGLYSPGTGQIAWSTSGKQTALRILADGKVGVDCSPTVALEVNGTIKASAIDAPIEGTLDDWIVHAGDSDTKIGFPGNDQFQIHAGGGPRLHVTGDGFIGINKTDPKTGLTINQFGTQPVVNGNTYPYPAGSWSTVWNTATANNTDYWVGFAGSYNVSSATVNISLAPNTYNFNTQGGMYIAGEAQSVSTSDFTIGKIIGGSQGGISASAGNQRATKSELFRIKSNGNTGINNTNPQRILHIGTSGTAEANIRIQGGADYGEIRVKDSDNALSFHHNVGGAGSRELFNANGSTGHFSINCYSYQALTITTNESGTNGPEIQLMHNSASPAANDVVGQLRYSGKDSAGNTELYAKIQTKVDDPTSGQETGHIDFSTRGLGAYNSIFRLKARGSASAPSYTTDDMNGIILDTYNTGNPYPRYFNFIAKSAGNTDSNIGFWTEKVGGSPTEKLRIAAANGIRSYATFVDTSYHANPDPFADGSGLAYYRLNYNFHDSGLYAKHATDGQGSPNNEFNGSPHFSLVNSSGEPCWDNPHEGAVNIPVLKNSYPFTVAAWVNMSSWPTTSNNDLIMNLNIAGQRVSICNVVWVNDTYSEWSIMYGGTNHWTFSPSSRPTNQWIHIVYSVVGNNNSSHAVYQNGTALSATNRGGGHGGTAGWAIGGNAQNSERFAMGRIGSIRFFNKALSSSEASALYTNDKFYT